MKYSILTGSFGYDGINEFLRDLSYGKGRTNGVRGAKIPKISKVCLITLFNFELELEDRKGEFPPLNIVYELKVIKNAIIYIIDYVIID